VALTDIFLLNIAEISTQFGNYLMKHYNNVEISTVSMTKTPKSGFKTIIKSHEFVDIFGVQKNCLWTFFAFFQVCPDSLLGG
jgi:hypothetical protein